MRWTTICVMLLSETGRPSLGGRFMGNANLFHYLFEFLKNNKLVTHFINKKGTLTLGKKDTWILYFLKKFF